MSNDTEIGCCNEEAARLLPWYVSGRLSALDVERVASHLKQCGICRRELSEQNALRSLLKSDTRVEYAPQPGLARTLSRIDELARDAPSIPEPIRARMTPAKQRPGAVQWLTAAVLLQAAALGWLGMSLHHQPAATRGEAPYQTLSSDTATVAGPHVRVVFEPAMTLAELQALLSAQQLTIVRGPSDAGAYTLSSTNPQLGLEQVSAAVLNLRRDAHVLFAEPAVNDSAR